MKAENKKAELSKSEIYDIIYYLDVYIEDLEYETSKDTIEDIKKLKKKLIKILRN